MSEVVQFGVEAVSTKSSGRVGGGNWAGAYFGEAVEKRISRLERFFALPENQRWVKLEHLMEGSASAIVAGKTIQMADHLVVHPGIRLPLTPDQQISLKVPEGAKEGETEEEKKARVAQEHAYITSWGCPACGSAHGSNIPPSKHLSAKNFGKTQWFYNPVTKRIFTMSDSCLETYFPGGSKSKRLIYAAELQPVKQQETAKK